LKLSAQQQQAQAQARSNLAVAMQSATQSAPHAGEIEAELTPKKKSRNARRNAARRLKMKTMSAAAAARQQHAPTMNLVAVQTATPPLPLAAAQSSALSQMAYKMLRPIAAARVVYETPAPAGAGKRDDSSEPPFAHM
jgi:hypothetical protein